MTLECMCVSETLSFYPSGLSALSTKVLREYHLVKELKTWSEAQSYCRETFNDLATVTNKEDNSRLQSALKGGPSRAWIGLRDDLTRWKWLLGNTDFNNDTDFSNWGPNEPDNKDSKEDCVAMTPEGLWEDIPCATKRHAVCYYSKKNPVALLEFQHKEKKIGENH